MKLEIFVTPTTAAGTIATTFPVRETDSVVNADDKNGVVTLDIAGNGLPDQQIAWIDAQKEQGKIERVETE